MIFIPNCVSVLTNERYKTCQTGFLFCRLGHAQGVKLLDTGGAQGGQKIVKHVRVAYRIGRDDQQNRMQVT